MRVKVSFRIDTFSTEYQTHYMPTLTIYAFNQDKTKGFKVAQILDGAKIDGSDLSAILEPMLNSLIENMERANVLQSNWNEIEQSNPAGNSDHSKP